MAVRPRLPKQRFDQTAGYAPPATPPYSHLDRPRTVPQLHEDWTPRTSIPQHVLALRHRLRLVQAAIELLEDHEQRIGAQYSALVAGWVTEFPNGTVTQGG